MSRHGSADCGENLRQLPWVGEAGFPYRLVGVAAVDDDGGVRMSGKFGRQLAKATGESVVEGGSGFHFNGQELVAVLNQQVHFVVAVVAVEEEVGALAAMIAVLQDLGHDKVLEQAAALGMGGNLSGILDAQEIGGQPGVVEIQFGALDQPLAEIGVPGLQKQHDIRGFQNADPMGDSGAGDADLVGETAGID